MCVVVVCVCCVYIYIYIYTSILYLFNNFDGVKNTIKLAHKSLNTNGYLEKIHKERRIK